MEPARTKRKLTRAQIRQFKILIGFYRKTNFRYLFGVYPEEIRDKNGYGFQEWAEMQLPAHIVAKKLSDWAKENVEGWPK